MATEKRLIDANALIEEINFEYDLNYGEILTDPVKFADMVDDAPTVDAVEVDEIRVDFMSLCLENQEAILSVSICGKPNEVKLPFSKEVAEVVHGRWVDRYGEKYANHLYECSECKKSALYDFKVDELGHEHAVQVLSDYCPNCGAKMDGDGK